ncbi:restriction endonuclease subunit S [Corynebacterium haemomassiliense]|uniref:restriction endonuclease subunit S n=1 Tax=Corynebacterium haemomassiliense TaxID=2754726 RepID=UPI002889D947|nr:hypothetical protein [Corynebacterium haemomassiliense]
MHSDEVRAPALRLEGFEGEWSETTLGQVSYRSAEKNSDQTYGETFTNSAQNGVVSQLDYFDNQVSNAANVGGYYVVKPGDFVYNPRLSVTAPVGPLNRNDLGRTGIVSPLYTVFTLTGLDSDFTKWLFKGQTWHRYMQTAGDSGVRGDRLSISNADFFDMPLNAPSRDEQRLIGDYLNRVETLVDSTALRLTSLTSLKKTLLVKMFPQGTASTPEVRFEGFEGDWERSELGQVVESFRYGVNAAAVPYDGATKYLRITDIDPGAGEFGTGEVTSPGVDRRTADDFLLEDGDLVFARTGATVGRSYLYREGVGRTVWAGFLIRAKLVAGSDPDFISASVLTPGYWEYVRMTSQRSGQPGLNSTEYARLPLWLPSHAEQQAIGAYFRSLDALIDAEQKKLDTLRNLKSALLTQIFV